MIDINSITPAELDVKIKNVPKERRDLLASDSFVLQLDGLKKKYRLLDELDQITGLEQLVVLWTIGLVQINEIEDGLKEDLLLDDERAKNLSADLSQILMVSNKSAVSAPSTIRSVSTPVSIKPVVIEEKNLPKFSRGNLGGQGPSTSSTSSLNYAQDKSLQASSPTLRSGQVGQAEPVQQVQDEPKPFIIHEQTDVKAGMPKIGGLPDSSRPAFSRPQFSESYSPDYTKPVASRVDFPGSGKNEPVKVVHYDAPKIPSRTPLEPPKNPIRPDQYASQRPVNPDNVIDLKDLPR